MRKKVPLGYKAALYLGHFNITKVQDEPTSLVRKIFSKPREIDPKRMYPFFKVMDDIAKAHDKTFAQIAINWLATNPKVPVLPIPGMKTSKHVIDIIGSIGWELTTLEHLLLDKSEKTSRF